MDFRGFSGIFKDFRGFSKPKRVSGIPPQGASRVRVGCGEGSEGGGVVGHAPRATPYQEISIHNNHGKKK